MNDAQNERPEQKQKRPYAKPEVTSAVLFERRSLTCGTQPNTGRTPGCGVYHSSVT